MRIGGWIRSRAEARGAAESEDPFDGAFLSRLDRARLRVGAATGERSGETPVRGRSQSSGIELESYQTYSPGDDIRHLDWLALGRTDQLLTRRFVAEREIAVHVLIDASASMGVPRADRKLAFALRAATAIAYVALNNNDSVRLAAMHGVDGRAEVSPTRLLRHRGRFAELKPFVTAVAAAGSTPFAGAVRSYLERHRERGLIFVLSDFLTEMSDVEDALRMLRSSKLEVRALHVVGREERDLGGLGGRLHLRDVESGAMREVIVGETDRRRYRDAFEGRRQELRQWCLRHGVGYVAAPTEDGVERLLVGHMTAAGMLRYR